MSMLKHELSGIFPNSKIVLYSRDALLNSYLPFRSIKFDIYDENNRFCIIDYLHLDKNEILTNNEKPCFIPSDIDKQYVEKYLALIGQKYPEDTARCLVNLFFDVCPRFNRFHWIHPTVNTQKENLLFHCVILVQKKHYQLVYETLQILFSAEKYSNFDQNVKIIHATDYHMFLVDISRFYHIIDHKGFAYRIKISDKHGVLMD